MKRIKLASIMLIAAMGLTGCTGTAVTENADNNKSTEQIEEATESDTESETKDIAELYRDIYEKASANGTLGSIEVTQSIVTRLGESGYTVVDDNNEINMVNADKMEEFCSIVDQKKDAELMLLTVTENGGFCRYDFRASEGSVSVRTKFLTWMGSGTQVDESENYTASTWIYTQNGYLLFEEYHPPGYDGPSGHTAIRVKSIDEVCRKYNRDYIETIGYDCNNMFITDWSEDDYQSLDFYDMYEMMYPIKSGQEMMTLGYEEGKTYEIPKDEFEGVINSYFNIDSQTLQDRTLYNEDTDIYTFRLRGMYDSCPPTAPVPEVESYTENGDGTITLTVNAVWEWGNNDKAFTHEVVIRPLEDGGVQYVSNHVIESEDNVEPSWYNKRLTDEEWQEYYGIN